MASFVVRSLAELGAALSFAPERQKASRLASGGIPLAELVTERIERASAAQAGGAVVLDTTHASDGILDLGAAMRARAAPRSAKKRVATGDLLVSRLRPYLRQIALAHPAALAACRGRPLLCSTEYIVLCPRRPADDVAFLLPFFLDEATQAFLAAGQEGGHHPRVPVDTLFRLRVPEVVFLARKESSRRVRAALAAAYRASALVSRAMRLG